MSWHCVTNVKQSQMLMILMGFLSRVITPSRAALCPSWGTVWWVMGWLWMFSTPPPFMTGRSGVSFTLRVFFSCLLSVYNYVQRCFFFLCSKWGINTLVTVYRFDNGWIIKIGRGLDYFKKPKVRLQLHILSNHLFFCYLWMLSSDCCVQQGRFSIGYCDYDLRHCHETSVDIFHTKHTKTLWYSSCSK